MNKHQLITNYYIAHRGELLAYASSRLCGNDLAEDIIQDVFLKLLTTDKLLSEVTLPALVYTILRNLINDYYRCHAVYEQYEHYIKDTCSEGTSMESVFSAHEIMERMERGLARVPENCREVYRMHIYDGMKVSEISRQLGEGYKSVEYRLGTARKVVRAYLSKAV